MANKRGLSARRTPTMKLSRPQNLGLVLFGILCIAFSIPIIWIGQFRGFSLGDGKFLVGAVLIAFGGYVVVRAWRGK